MAENKQPHSEEEVPFKSEAIPLHGPLTEAEREKVEREHREEEQRRIDNEYKGRQLTIAERQLTTNRRLAVYTLLLVALGLIGNGVAFIAANAARRSADASGTSLKLTGEIAVSDQRAWVGIKDIRLRGQLVLGQPVNVEVNLLNVEKTPANDVQVSEFIFGFTETQILDQAGFPDRGVVMPNNPWQLLPSIRAGRIDAEHMRGNQAGTTRLYIRGTVVYMDIFKQTPRHTRFCAFYPTLQPPMFFNCTQGNSMD